MLLPATLWPVAGLNGKIAPVRLSSGKLIVALLTTTSVWLLGPAGLYVTAIPCADTLTTFGTGR